MRGEEVPDAKELWGTRWHEFFHRMSTEEAVVGGPVAQTGAVVTEAEGAAKTHQVMYFDSYDATITSVSPREGRGRRLQRPGRGQRSSRSES